MTAGAGYRRLVLRTLAVYRRLDARMAFDAV